jgi:2-keto-4-pentenoate hydratase/2-oxohepta-3-ene-1,7-dioic acid hydratase in catechol pathway
MKPLRDGPKGQVTPGMPDATGTIRGLPGLVTDIAGHAVGKGADTFARGGPWLVTRDEVPSRQALAHVCAMDGVRAQTGDIGTMIFGVQTLASRVPHRITLHPGDSIVSRTPPGAGLGRQRQRPAARHV